MLGSLPFPDGSRGSSRHGPPERYASSLGLRCFTHHDNTQARALSTAQVCKKSGSCSSEPGVQGDDGKSCISAPPDPAAPELVAPLPCPDTRGTAWYHRQVTGAPDFVPFTSPPRCCTGPAAGAKPSPELLGQAGAGRAGSRQLGGRGDNAGIITSSQPSQGKGAAGAK